MAMAALIEQRQHEPAWTNADWPCHANVNEPAWPAQRPARLTGHWLADKVVYLDNRVMADRTGFYVLVPLQLDPAPACGPATVLVQRGWLPRHPSQRELLPAFTLPSGLALVYGRLVGETSQAYQLGQEAPIDSHTSGPLLRQNIGKAEWAAWLGHMPAAGALLELNQGEPAGSQDMLRAWPAPDFGVGKHQAYAAQWFAMALIITGLYVWHQLLRPSRSH